MLRCLIVTPLALGLDDTKCGISMRPHGMQVVIRLSSADMDRYCKGRRQDTCIRKLRARSNDTLTDQQSIHLVLISGELIDHPDRRSPFRYHCLRPLLQHDHQLHVLH
jgi:hypothetical protein